MELGRELFIRHALVDGEWKNSHAFVKSNNKLLEELQAASPSNVAASAIVAVRRAVAAGIRRPYCQGWGRRGAARGSVGQVVRSSTARCVASPSERRDQMWWPAIGVSASTATDAWPMEKRSHSHG